MKTPLAFHNGRFLPAKELAISPVDTGFVQGTTVAEQLRTFGGRLFHIEDHFRRLWNSLALLEINPPVAFDDLLQAAGELVAANHRLLAPGDDLGLSVFVTPGLYPSYSEGPAGPASVCMHTYPLPFRLWAKKYTVGQRLLTTPVRQVPTDCWPPQLKCRSRMHYFLADRQAAKIDSEARALMLDHQDWVTEASTANVLAYGKECGLVSPPLTKVLHGISLDVASRLAAGWGVGLKYRELAVADLLSADEFMLTSTPFCLLPVTRLNDRPIGSGTPGPLFARILAAWSQQVGIGIRGQAEQFASRPG